jgi:hypothetical protein
MRRCPKAEESDTITAFDSCNPQASEPDDACAKERRCVQVIEALGKGKHEIGSGHSKLGVSSINRVSGESGRVAKIL